MTHLYVYSCCRWSTYILYKCKWQQLYDMFSEYKNDLDSCWCIKLTIKLLIMSWAQS